MYRLPRPVSYTHLDVYKRQDPRNLAHMISMIPSDCTWTVAGIGRHELPLGAMAIILGGHVRVGFEDNIYYSRGDVYKRQYP